MTPPLTLHSRALLAEDRGEALLVGPDHLLVNNLLRELDSGHCVRWVIGDVILTLVSRALPLIDIMALDQGGGAGLGQKPGLDDIIQP